MKRGCYHMLPPLHLHPLQLWTCKWWQGFPILICVINMLKWRSSICGFRHNPNTSIIWQHIKIYKKVYVICEVFFPKYSEFGPLCPWNYSKNFSWNYFCHVECSQHFCGNFFFKCRHILAIFSYTNSKIIWKKHSKLTAGEYFRVI
jgi:hypothetical protein